MTEQNTMILNKTNIRCNEVNIAYLFTLWWGKFCFVLMACVCTNMILNDFGKELQGDSLSFPPAAPEVDAIYLKIWHQSRKGKKVYLLFD